METSPIGLAIEQKLVFILAAACVIIGISAPAYAFFAIPAAMAYGLIFLAAVVVFRKFDLNSYWWSQLLPALSLWPVLFNVFSSTTNTTLIHLCFLILACAHIGGAILWFTGIYRNVVEFPTVTDEFPKSSVLSIPLFLFILWKTFSTYA